MGARMYTNTLTYLLCLPHVAEQESSHTLHCTLLQFISASSVIADMAVCVHMRK